MQLSDAVRVLSCRDIPPPSSIAMLLLADAPSLSVMEEDEIAYVPPPLFPAVLLLMELLDAVRVLSCRYIPPPYVAAALPFTDVPWLIVMEDFDIKYAPPPVASAMLLFMELLHAVRVLFFR